MLPKLVLTQLNPPRSKQRDRCGARQSNQEYMPETAVQEMRHKVDIHRITL